MNRWNQRLAFVVVLSWLLCAARPAAAVAPETQDHAKFFSAEAIKKANEQIRELYQKHGRDFLIETYETVPADQVEKVKAMSREERLKFFETWAKARIQQRAVTGVYVIICKDPTMLHVEVAGKGRTLDPAERNKLRNQLIDDFRAKHYDEALANAIKFVQEKVGDSR
jgi:uncharacterized membrane protein YgcG